jgi:hypothetical protein
MYLKSQIRKNLAKAALCLIFFGLIFLAVSLRVLYTLSLDLLDEAALLFSLVPLATFYFYLRKYRIYNGGYQGEKTVAKRLSKTLSDKYTLINDLYLGSGGDIDHIILGPNGIFVLETKNWSGKITCNGDEWHRTGKPNVGSPSCQAKRNAAKIRNIIDASPTLNSTGIWVEAIVVFTNKNASLQLNNPTVPILRLKQLTNYIITRRSIRLITQQEIEQIGKGIVKNKN